MEIDLDRYRLEPEDEDPAPPQHKSTPLRKVGGFLLALWILLIVVGFVMTAMTVDGPSDGPGYEKGGGYDHCYTAALCED